ncbi:MAG: hypothetical protein ACRCYY_02840 [Trueperaceae bacterium]
MVAKRELWKNLPMPDKKETLNFSNEYSLQEFGIICQGLIPEQMEDKWFIFYEEPCLYFHRSWTGYCIYQLEFKENDGMFGVIKAWVNRDPEQYKETDLVYDQELLYFLVERMLLQKNIQFPLPKSMKST